MHETTAGVMSVCKHDLDLPRHKPMFLPSRHHPDDPDDPNAQTALTALLAIVRSISHTMAAAESAA